LIAGDTHISTLSRLLYIAYFLEVGLILVFVPWSAFWERNYFAESLPLLQAMVKNNFVRGAVSGIGVLNLVAGLSDLRTMMPWAHR
jgi:hypothetical protein